MRFSSVTVLLLFAGLLPSQAPVNGGQTGPIVPVPKKPATGETKPGDAATPAKPPTANPADPNSRDDKAKPVAPAKVEAGKPKPANEVEEDDEALPAPAQLPKSADPADIAAMQSAQNMIRAEARLKRLLEKGAIPGIEKILTFEEISSWPYQDGLKGMPEPVKKMDGKTVLMTGFMLPIDEVENIKEFLLVQSMWSCCFGQPPDINGIVRVVMKGDKRINFKYDPIKVTGQFKVVAAYEDGYCIDIYQLHADEVDVIK